MLVLGDKWAHHFGYISVESQGQFVWAGENSTRTHLCEVEEIDLVNSKFL